ncbi:hypothetical protein [Thalassovita sp.]|uniref:hypothetical protein n=1 Tax=Thalassovita sp. TaxID=1979401 RepID=UPI0028826701|nr:hypothetical protein [Thalassovita sp.]MDF1804360.1 hypothetical protein [Thalassovita sp.]
MAVTLATCPQKSLAEGFTGAEFLQQSTQEQRGYVSTQLVMASSIAARIKPSLAECIGRVFFDGSGLSDQGFDMVLARIEEFKAYHPSSVIVVVIESQCEPFN